MKKCPRCHILQDGIEECLYCGLIFAEFVETDDKIENKNKNYNLIIVVTAFILISLLSVYFLNLYNSTNNKVGHDKPSLLLKNENNNNLTDMVKDLTQGSSVTNSMLNTFLPKNNNTAIIEIIASTIFSIIGMIYFSYGKRKNQLLILISGISLMVYPYLINNIFLSVLTGIFLSLLPFIIKLLKN